MSRRETSSEVGATRVSEGLHVSPKKRSFKCFLLMEEFRQEGKFCDVNIVIDGTTFPCHRLVLASASTFFKTMFNGQYKESEEKDIQLKNLSADCFKVVLDFFYNKELNIDSSNSYELLEASMYFGAKDMEHCCVEDMLSYLPKKHIVETCIYAKSNNRTQLYEKSLSYIANNWSKLCRENRLLEISAEILQDVVKRKSLIKPIDDLVNFITSWKEKQNADANEVEKLLEKLTPDYRPTPCLYVHVFVLDKGDYDGTLNELRYDGKTEEWKRERAWSRVSTREANVVSNGHLFTFFSPTMMNQEFRVKKDLYSVYEILKLPPIKRKGCTYYMTPISDNIYLYDANGRDYFTNESIEAENSEKSTRLFSYVYNLDEWFTVPKPQYELPGWCITSVNNLLFLIGNDKLQCYDHRSPNWTMLPEMSSGAGDVIACSYNSKVYVFGDRKSGKGNLEVYDPVAGRWELLSPLLNQINWGGELSSFVCYHDKLWAFRHHYQFAVQNNSSEMAACYDPITNSWATIDARRELVPGMGFVNGAFVW